MDKTCFLIMFRSEAGERLTRIVIESLRTFGGALCDCPVWAFVLDERRLAQALPGMPAVEQFPLDLDQSCPPYPFVEKVFACARAEELAGPEIRSLVWLSLDGLIINPPVLFDLSRSSGASPAEAVFRPVHIRNVGSPTQESPDDFWQGIYRALEIGELPGTVESFVDRQTLRPYFNTHCFAFNPAAGLGQAWWEIFKALVPNQGYQQAVCQDELHRVFLHQAVLSTVVVKRLAWERVRLLPPEYNYPLNLLGKIPPERRAASLNHLVNAVYEEAFPWGEIEIEPPLREWLSERLSG
jgi:hypothetical protein